MPNISLGGHFEEFVEAQLKSGRFHDVSEVVRAGLRLLEEQQQERAQRASQLADSINASFDEPGEDSPAEDMFDRLERRYSDEVNARSRGA